MRAAAASALLCWTGRAAARSRASAYSVCARATSTLRSSSGFASSTSTSPALTLCPSRTATRRTVASNGAVTEATRLAVTSALRSTACGASVPLSERPAQAAARTASAGNHATLIMGQFLQAVSCKAHTRHECTAPRMAGRTDAVAAGRRCHPRSPGYRGDRVFGRPARYDGGGDVARGRNRARQRGRAARPGRGARGGAVAGSARGRRTRGIRNDSRKRNDRLDADPPHHRRDHAASRNESAGGDERGVAGCIRGDRGGNPRDDRVARSAAAKAPRRERLRIGASPPRRARRNHHRGGRSPRARPRPRARAAPPHPRARGRQRRARGLHLLRLARPARADRKHRRLQPGVRGRAPRRDGTRVCALDPRRLPADAGPRRRAVADDPVHARRDRARRRRRLGARPRRRRVAQAARAGARRHVQNPERRQRQRRPAPSARRARESDGERVEVHAEARDGDDRVRRAERAPLRARRRRRLRPERGAEDVPRLPAPALARPVRGHRHRPGDGRADPAASRRKDVGGGRGGEGRDVLLHDGQAMKPLRVLLVEDSERDAARLTLELRRSGYAPEITRVETLPRLREGLGRGGFDLVISDYLLPTFNASDALALFREQSIDVPFIVVSGAVGEDIAVEVMKSGAHDYVLKDRMVRLVPAIERELADAKERGERRKLQTLFQSILRSSPYPSVIVRRDGGGIVHLSDSFRRQLMHDKTLVPGQRLLDLVDFAHPERIAQVLTRGGTAPYVVYSVDGQNRVANVRVHTVEHHGTTYANVVIEDVTEQHYLKTAFDAVNDAVVIVSSSQTLLYANRAAEELWSPLYFGADVHAIVALAGDPRVTMKGATYEVRAIPFRFAGENETSMILKFRNVSQEEELMALSTHDRLPAGGAPPPPAPAVAAPPRCLPPPRRRRVRDPVSEHERRRGDEHPGKNLRDAGAQPIPLRRPVAAPVRIVRHRRDRPAGRRDEEADRRRAVCGEEQRAR